VINVMAELGGAACVSAEVLKRTERGLRRILHALDMVTDPTPEPAQGTRLLNANGSIYAYNAGLFEPLKAIGDDVCQGETVARLHHPETPGWAPDTVASGYEGIVLAMRAMAQVRRGDALYQIASDVGLP